MIAVQMSDKDAAQAAHIKAGGFDQTMLGRFTTIEEPQFAALGQLEGNARDVAVAGGNARASAQKG